MYNLSDIIQMQEDLMVDFYDNKEKDIKELKEKIRNEKDDIERQILFEELKVALNRKWNFHPSLYRGRGLFGIF